MENIEIASKLIKDGIIYAMNFGLEKKIRLSEILLGTIFACATSLIDVISIAKMRKILRDEEINAICKTISRKIEEIEPESSKSSLINFYPGTWLSKN